MESMIITLCEEKLIHACRNLWCLIPCKRMRLRMLKSAYNKQSQIREVLNATWFLVPGCEVVTEARRGSRPGDSMPDLLFTIAFRYLLAKVQSELHDYGVLTEMWCHSLVSCTKSALDLLTKFSVGLDPCAQVLVGANNTQGLLHMFRSRSENVVIFVQLPSTLYTSCSSQVHEHLHWVAPHESTENQSGPLPHG